MGENNTFVSRVNIYNRTDRDMTSIMGATIVLLDQLGNKIMSKRKITLNWFNSNKTYWKLVKSKNRKIKLKLVS